MIASKCLNLRLGKRLGSIRSGRCMTMVSCGVGFVCTRSGLITNQVPMPPSARLNPGTAEPYRPDSSPAPYAY